MSSSAPHDPNGVWCIVVAGGSGRRWGGPKQFEQLAGERVVDRAVRVAASVCEGVVLVLPAGSDDVAVPGATATVAGGATRSASVRAGLAAVPAEAEVVLVHDAARPLASDQLFRDVVGVVRGGAAAAVPAVPVTDTIRSVDGGVVDRDLLRAVQTPQGFAADVLRAVHRDEPEGTDDAGLVEAAGHRVELVAGERRNLKLTEPDDRIVAEALLAAVDPDTTRTPDS